MSAAQPQVQLQLAVDAVHALLVPRKVLDVAQVQETQAKSPVLLVPSQALQPVGNLCIFVRQLGLIAETGLADRKIGAGLPDAGTLAACLSS
jgi:hypothetical protein